MAQEFAVRENVVEILLQFRGEITAQLMHVRGEHVVDRQTRHDGSVDLDVALGFAGVHQQVADGFADDALVVDPARGRAFRLQRPLHLDGLALVVIRQSAQGVITGAGGFKGGVDEPRRRLGDEPEEWRSLSDHFGGRGEGGLQGGGVPRPVKAAALQNAHETGSVLPAPDPAAPHRREGPEGCQWAGDDSDERTRLRLEQVCAKVAYPAAVQADARSGGHGWPLGDLHLGGDTAPLQVGILHHLPQVLLDEFSGQ